MSKVNTIRQELENAIETEAKELLSSGKLNLLKKQFEDFENDCYMVGSVREFDQYGELNSSIELDLSELDGIDKDVANEALNQLLLDSCNYIQRDGSAARLVQYLGEPIIINDYGDFVVYSNELGLKIYKNELIGDDNHEKRKHALYLIEKAMRKAGYFPNIVLVDYYGSIIKELTTNLGQLSDDELESYGEKFHE